MKTHRNQLTGAALLAIGLAANPAVAQSSAGPASDTPAPPPTSTAQDSVRASSSPTDPSGRPIDRGDGENPNRINRSSPEVGSDNPRPEADASGVAVEASGQPAHVKTEEIIGQMVRGRGDEKLGRVSDLVVEASGQVHYAIVTSGGILGIGGTRRAVPLNALQRSEGLGQHLSLDVDQARWDNAPRFRDDDLATLNQETRAQELHQYFGQDWEDTRHSHRAQNASPSDGNGAGAALVLVSDLDGQDIRAGDKTVGNVEHVLIDWKRRLAALLVDVDDDFADAAGDYVIGFNHVALSGSGRELVLSTQLSAADFHVASGPTSDPLDSGRLYAWAEGAEGQTTRTTAPTDAAQAHPNSGLEATRAGANYATTDTPRVTQATGDSAASGSRRWLPAESGTGDDMAKDRPGAAAPAGERLTYRHADAVLQALHDDAGIRSAARSVDVIARGDALVLFGNVSSEDDRERIVATARRAAGDQRIEDQIRVRGAAE